MSRETWLELKESKTFYVATYRGAATMVIVSSLLNLALCCGIYYTYFNRPERHYYATNGVTPPIELTAMKAPNNSSVALLPPDPTNVEAPKVIPQ